MTDGGHDMSDENTREGRNPQHTGNDRAPNLPADKARQGRWGGRVLMVLIAALILAAVAWWAAEIYGVAIEPTNPTEDAPPPSTQQNPAQ